MKNIRFMSDDELEQELEILDPTIAVLNREMRKRLIAEEQMRRLKEDNSTPTKKSGRRGI